jgi:hypothetical protein
VQAPPTARGRQRVGRTSRARGELAEALRRSRSSWHRLPSPPVPTYGASVTWTGNELVFSGASFCLPFMFCPLELPRPLPSYDPATGRWRSLPADAHAAEVPVAWTGHVSSSPRAVAPPAPPSTRARRTGSTYRLLRSAWLMERARCGPAANCWSGAVLARQGAGPAPALCSRRELRRSTRPMSRRPPGRDQANATAGRLRQR